MSIQTILGNEAIALGVVEQGCRVVTAYPGTPSSEILSGVVKFKKQLNRNIYTEWSTNEKVAFEVALAASWSGLRAAVAMKQVGLNVASDPLFSSAYTGVKGGFLIIPADDPGPHSSQTEQDSRLLALTAKVPVFDPSSPEEAREMVGLALELSERYRTPVILRPTTRLCHAVQSLEIDDLIPPENAIPEVKFRKDPKRWTATPKFRNLLHKELNNKLLEIEEEFNKSTLNFVLYDDINSSIGIIASGVAFHTVEQSLAELGNQIPILKIGTPHPLPRKIVEEFSARFDKVLVIEEPDVCIEIQLNSREKVHGRFDETFPKAGELTPEVVTSILHTIFNKAGITVNSPPNDVELEDLVSSLPLPIRRPRLCPGCSHRSAFYTIKKEFGSKGIYPGDIGCYTLGMNLRAVDTFVDMGASITMANGFYQANQILNDKRPIIATIGDSTFLHSGIPSLINAVHTGARFVLVILDNRTTAMTGFQPTPANTELADGSDAAQNVSIVDLVRACGVDYVKEVDPYNQDEFQELLQAAFEYSQSLSGSVAVVIADRPCVLYDPTPLNENPIPVVITEECDGCRYCLEVFECPAMSLSSDKSRVDINQKICVDCGQCLDSCYKGFILPDLTSIINKQEVPSLTRSD
ncbi:MAG: indolepyruvate ferredoxin oxidoreductase subunit alpha [Chloroflexi bacterium]|nr:indolepyruvate ferredoxin oxidoreductase subunit alpha [Chloroflexota bacterium]